MSNLISRAKAKFVKKWGTDAPLALIRQTPAEQADVAHGGPKGAPSPGTGPGGADTARNPLSDTQKEAAQ
jgi:hypothetical protein